MNAHVVPSEEMVAAHSVPPRFFQKALGPEEFVRCVGDFVDFAHLTLSVEVVAACSLRCPGCWVGMARPEMWTAGPGEVMAPALLDAALTFGREIGAAQLTLLGGEPTLHPDLPTIIRTAVGGGYRVSVTTNGVCSPHRLEKVLASGLHGTSFSLDGSRPEIHDVLRPSPSGRSTFHITLESIRHAVRYRADFGYKIGVNHTIYPYNLYDAEAMIRLSASLGVDRIRLHFTLPGDSPEPDGRMTHLEPARWMALRQRIAHLAQEFGVPVSAVPGYGEAAVTAARQRKSPYLNIQPDGNILPCAAYARLSASTARAVGRLLPTGKVALNPGFLQTSARAARHCCRAIPAVLARLPEVIQEAIKRAGGMGCIILDGSLLSSAEDSG